MQDSFLQESCHAGRIAFLERKPLLSIWSYDSIAAEIPVNKEAENYLNDKEYAVVASASASSNNTNNNNDNDAKRNQQPLVSVSHLPKD
jgi:predicted transcriptional regulator